MCSEECADDPSIEGADRCYRRIPDNWVIFDENLQRNRPTSAAFEDNRDGTNMSVHLGSALEAHGLPASSVLTGHHANFYGVVWLSADQLREGGQALCRRPEPPHFPAHAEAKGNKTGRPGDRLRRNWAKIAEWEIAVAPRTADA